MTLISLLTLLACRNDKDLVDSGLVLQDLDGDGLVEDDCDDQDPDVGAPTDWYADADGDGYGGDTVVTECDAPDGHVAQGGDCDDQDPAVHPDAAEDDCTDPTDYNCDGSVGFADADGDGYPACEDCDDADPASNEELTFYADADADGFGDAAAPVQACALPEGASEDATDCDDGDAAVNPDADELCNDIDDDCDGDTDEDDATDAATWYGDGDGDGFGDAALSMRACDPPTGFVDDDTDCDDGDIDVNPDATETCNQVDDDCDGTTDEDDAADASTWYADIDTDGFGDPGVSTVACDQPSGFVDDDTDCDDGDVNVNPDATEACNGVDDDCDQDTDEGLLGTGASCPATSCLEVLGDGQTTDGTYVLSDSGGSSTFDAWCDLTTDGGGWTLVGSVVNEASVSGSHARNWNSYAVWTDDSTFGSIGARDTADYKGEAFAEISGDDVLFLTDEYGFGFDGVLGGQPYGDHVAAEYGTSCNTTTLADGADYYDTLSASEAAAFVYIIRPLDTNATCFPNGNENAIIGLQLNTCCWAGGLGNTPSGYPSWQVYDNSLLDHSRIHVASCTAGVYPCNANGYAVDGFTYTYDSKVTWAEIYVR